MALQPNSTKGVQTGAWLLVGFMLGFFLLGYTMFLSICLGAIVGLTGGFIASWWNATEDYITDEEATEIAIAEDSAPSTLAKARPRRYGVGVRPARRNRQTRAVRRFGWLFRRNK